MSKSKTPHPPPPQGRDGATGAKPGDAPAQDQRDGEVRVRFIEGPSAPTVPGEEGPKDLESLESAAGIDSGSARAIADMAYGAANESARLQAKAWREPTKVANENFAVIQGRQDRGEGLLRQVLRKQDEQGEKQDEQGKQLVELVKMQEEQGRRQDEQGKQLVELVKMQEEQGRRQDEQGKKQDEQGKKQDEQGKQLAELVKMQEEQGRRQDEQGKKQDEQGKQLAELVKTQEEQGRKQDEQGWRLDQHGKQLAELGRKQDQHGKLLAEVVKTQDEQGWRLDQHGKLLAELVETQKEQSKVLARVVGIQEVHSKLLNEQIKVISNLPWKLAMLVVGILGIFVVVIEYRIASALPPPAAPQQPTIQIVPPPPAEPGATGELGGGVFPPPAAVVESSPPPLPQRILPTGGRQAEDGAVAGVAAGGTDGLQPQLPDHRHGGAAVPVCREAQAGRLREQATGGSLNSGAPSTRPPMSPCADSSPTEPESAMVIRE